jgi:hypothetical protein
MPVLRKVSRAHRESVGELLVGSRVGKRCTDQTSLGAGERYSVGFGRLAEKRQRVRGWAATVALVSVMLSAAACGGEGESGREADPETTRSVIEETTAETTRAREAASTGELAGRGRQHALRRVQLPGERAGVLRWPRALGR